MAACAASVKVFNNYMVTNNYLYSEIRFKMMGFVM